MEGHLERERGGDAKLKVLIWHLVTTFPQAAILSRQVEDTYHLFIIVFYGGAPEKAIQVERALLVDRDSSLDEFSSFLASLNLPTLLQGCDRYDLRHASRSQIQQACTRPGVSGSKAGHECLSGPANGGWPSIRNGGTVSHGHRYLSGPYLPSPVGAVSPLFS